MNIPDWLTKERWNEVASLLTGDGLIMDEDFVDEPPSRLDQQTLKHMAGSGQSLWQNIRLIDKEFNQ